MKIAIIGKGNVGRALGEGWLKHGHDVIYGSRTSNVSVRDAVKSGDVVVLAVPWNAVPGAILAAGDLRGRILLDPTVPFLPDLSGLDLSVQPSGGEIVAALTPGAHVVKIFCTTGAGNMANPDYHGEPATMFYCGDDAAAKSVAGVLAIDLGFDPVDAGALNQSHVLETLGQLWVTLAYKQGLGMNIAFKLMRR